MSITAKEDPAGPTQVKSNAISLWVCVVIAFLILIAAWTTLIMVANNNKVETIPLNHSTP